MWGKVRTHQKWLENGVSRSTKNELSVGSLQRFDDDNSEETEILFDERMVRINTQLIAKPKSDLFSAAGCRVSLQEKDALGLPSIFFFQGVSRDS